MNFEQIISTFIADAPAIAALLFMAYMYHKSMNTVIRDNTEAIRSLTNAILSNNKNNP